MNIRPLTEADAAVYQRVRLRSLQEHPEAFGSSYEEERETTPDKVAALLASPDSRFFGAFVDGDLAGIANLWRYPRTKTRHRAMLTAMYVAPEARGQGIGAALVKAVLDYARSVTGLEDVVLAVTVGNGSARGLYIRAGFQAYSLDPRYIRVGDDYHDIEWMMLRLNEG